MNDLGLPVGLSALELVHGKANILPYATGEVIRLLNKLVPYPLDRQGISFPDPVEARETILELEKALLEASDIQMQLETAHRWIDGIYARELFIPKGTLLTGRIHRHACISIMSKGDKTTITEDGAMRLKAPFATISKPGVKRVGLAHEDTIWTTFHATDERDLKKLEEDLFCDSYDGVTFDDPDISTVITKEGKICRPC